MNGGQEVPASRARASHPRRWHRGLLLPFNTARPNAPQTPMNLMGQNYRRKMARLPPKRWLILPPSGRHRQHMASHAVGRMAQVSRVFRSHTRPGPAPLRTERRGLPNAAGRPGALPG